MINRRKLVIALGAGALAAPLRPFAQQQIERTYRLGWLSVTPRNEPYIVAFVQRLRDFGFIEGRNLVIEYRNGGGQADRLPTLAADLAGKNCDVFVSSGTEANLTAIEQASRNTPIVMVAIDYDPVATGHIRSLARPGDRITGVSQLQVELPPKRLELLKELLPKARRIAVLSDSSTMGQLEAVQIAAKRLGVALKLLELKRQPYDYESAFDEATRAKSEGLLALASGFFVPARRLIPELALKHHLPSMFGNNLWPESGGLMSYGPNFSESFLRAAEQVSKILKGAKPNDLPVEQPTALELVVNMKTATALGIKIPQSILVQATKVIE